MVIWGDPVRPPTTVRPVMRARSGSRIDHGCPRKGAGNGVVGRQRTVPGGSNSCTCARAASRTCIAGPRSLSAIAAACASCRATLKAKRGLVRSTHFAESLPRFVGLQYPLGPSPIRQRLRPCASRRLERLPDAANCPARWRSSARSSRHGRILSKGPLHAGRQLDRLSPANIGAVADVITTGPNVSLALP